MLKIVAITLVILIAAVLIYASTKPDTFQIQRTIRIKAPPEKIFPLIGELRAWLNWSPYEKKDPEMKRTFSGPSAGEGAMYAWDGNREIGAGSMEITQSLPPSKLVIKLDFVRPFECHNIVEFTLEPEGETTQVTWAMHGPMRFITKLVTIVFSMDKMVGKDYEAGLAALKAAAEN
ncbi:MAG: SRPBCC family protein [Methylococcus sp.]|nr:SRPBCC family protein [Methylococcus sp.]